MQRNATLCDGDAKLVNAFSTFRNSAAPFSIQCGRKQNGTENRKARKKRAKKTMPNKAESSTKRRRSRKEEEEEQQLKAPELYTGNCGTVCVSICYCLFTSPSDKILNGNFAIWFIEGVWEGQQERQLCLHCCKFLPKISTEMNSFMA